MTTKELPAATKGLLIGIVMGVAVALVFVVQAAWSDPTQAPPNGGGFRIEPSASAPTACNAAAEGRLWMDSGINKLKVCSGTAWETITSS